MQVCQIHGALHKYATLIKSNRLRNHPRSDSKVLIRLTGTIAVSLMGNDTFSVFRLKGNIYNFDAQSVKNYFSLPSENVSSKRKERALKREQILSL